METCFELCSTFTRMEEGGYVDDPRDSGNWSSGHVGQGTLIGSNMGVGAPALLAWEGTGTRLIAEQMRHLSQDTYKAIARTKYWTPLGGAVLPAGVDLMSFDFGWNRGIATSLSIMIQCLAIDKHQAIRLQPAAIVQAILTISSSVILLHIAPTGLQILQKAMGVLADGVLGKETAEAFAERRDLRIMAIILALSTAQVRSYRQLTTFPVYGKGWLARTARRQAAALSAAHQAVVDEPTLVI